MAEEKNTPKSGLLNLDNPDMKTSYANFSHVHLNATDVYLYFGIQAADGGVEDVSIENRIIVTHDSFMRMMEFWAARYSTLVAIYGDAPRSFRDFDPEKVRQAFSHFIGQQEQDVQEKQEDAQEETDA